jgi:predicted transposase/invertase (TIGR01784 family)
MVNAMSKSNTEIQLVRFDWAIKTILRDKANFDVLEGFLTALLNEDITIEQILESESNAEEGYKFNRVDILVHDSQGRKLIIEVQNDRETDYMERLLFGTSKVIVDNIAVGETYRQVVKVISISILYYNLGIGDDYVYKYVGEFIGLHNKQVLKIRQRVATATSFKYVAKNIFPEYYLINVERFEDLIHSPLDEWIYLLKHSAVKADFQAKNIDKAAQKLAVLKMGAEERRRYESYMKAVVIERDVLETARRDGMQEGLKEGRQEGRQAAVRLLLKLIRQRFGDIPAWVQESVENANLAQLEQWGDAILTVTALSDLFNTKLRS